MAVPLIVVAGVIIIPTLVVAVGSFWSAPFLSQPGELTFDNYLNALRDSRSVTAAWSTVQMTFGASAYALAIGGLQAWIVARTNVPLRRFVRWLPVAPLLLSALVVNSGFIALYSGRTGLVNAYGMRFLGLNGPIFDVYSMIGLVIVLGSHLAPIAYLVMLPPLTSMGRSLEEASRSSGAGGWHTYWHVTLPLLRPALLSAFTLTAILASHAFETPLLIGLPAQITTYVSEIYLSITASVNYSQASAQAMVYLVLIGLLLLWNRRVTRVESRFAVIAGKDHNPNVREYGAFRYLLLAVIVGIFMFGFLTPLAANAFNSLLPALYRVSGPLPDFTLENYRAALATPSFVPAVRNSLVLGVSVALIGVSLATLLAVIAYKTHRKGRRLAEEIGTLPVAFPPLVFSMALLITVLSIPGAAELYNTVLLLVIVLVVVFLPFALRIMSSAVISIDDSLLEASASSGSRMFRTTRTIVLPLMMVGLIGAFALVFIFSFRELGAIALVVPPNIDLLPSLIYGMYESGVLAVVYALNIISFLITSAAFIGVSLVVALLRRRIGRVRSHAFAVADFTPADR